MLPHVRIYHNVCEFYIFRVHLLLAKQALYSHWSKKIYEMKVQNGDEYVGPIMTVVIMYTYIHTYR